MAGPQAPPMPELGAVPASSFQDLPQMSPGLMAEQAAVGAGAGEASAATEDSLEITACASKGFSTGKSQRIRNRHMKQTLPEAGCHPIPGGGEQHGQRPSSFPCLLGRIDVGVVASTEGAAAAGATHPEDLHFAASPTATKPPYAEAVEASSRFSVGSVSNHQKAPGIISEGGSGRLLAAWQELFPEATELGIGASPPPADSHLAIPCSADLDSRLPMKVPLPSCGRMPWSSLDPYPAAFDRGLGFQAPPPPAQPLAPPPGLAASAEGALADAARRHVMSMVNSSFATDVLAVAPGLCCAAPRLSTHPVPAAPCVGPTLSLPREHLRCAADLRACGSPPARARVVGAAPGLSLAALQLGAYLPATASPTVATPVLRVPPEHFCRAEEARACTSLPAEAPAGSPTASPTLPPAVEHHLRRANDSGASGSPSPETSPVAGSSPCSDVSREKRFTCKFVFSGFDLERDADFELVPRLIGRGGVNMRDIAKACDGKVRIRGRGSGHREHQRGRAGLEEADVPLQIALSCKDRGCFEEGRKRLVELLGFINTHFERYCRKKGLVPVPVLYGIVGCE